MSEPIQIPEDVYVSMEDWGFCKSCGKWNDRRFGVCFDCGDYTVTDNKLVWDARHPERKWRVVDA